VWILPTSGLVLRRDVGKVVQQTLSVREYDCVPIRQVQNIPLALEDGHKKRSTEEISIEEAGQFGTPVSQLLRDSARLIGAAAGRNRLDGVE
jgi:hypothetical protein